MTDVDRATWHKTACILCSLNCGLEVQVGGEGNRHIAKLRGDKDHPISQGYLCEKAQRLDFYQTAGDRLERAAATPSRRQLRGDRLGHRHPRGSGEAR